MVNVFLSKVAPALGAVVANMMFASPFRQVQQVRKDGNLGDLNPVPFPLIFANCAGWIGYSIVTMDAFVFLANCFGLLIGLYFSLVAYGYSTDKNRDRLIGILVFFSTILEVVGFTGVKARLSHDDMILLWGITSNVILLVFYCSPLTTVLLVIRSRSSASLNLPLVVMTIINGTLWVAYGLAINDYFIYVPNGIGAFLGVVQAVLIFLFPRISYSSLSDGRE